MHSYWSTPESDQRRMEQLRGFDSPHADVDERRQTESRRRRRPDPLWSQMRLEAQHALTLDLDAGQQLYQHVLRHPSLIGCTGEHYQSRDCHGVDAGHCFTGIGDGSIDIE